MRARHELHKLAAGGRLYNFGGDKQQNTTSTTQNYDQRQVITNDTTYNDLSDRSVNTSNYDLSNHSVTNNDLSDHSTNFSSTSTVWDSSTKIDSHNVTTSVNNSVTNNDLSNRSVTNIDSSNRSVNNTSTVWDSSNRSVTNVDDHSVTNYLDAGAVSGGLAVANNAVGAVASAAAGGVKVATDSVAAMLQSALAALGLASSVTTAQTADTAHAYDYADQLFHASLDAVNQNDARALDAFTRAATMENDALAMSQAAAKQALDQVQNAYADAKGTTQSQQKIMIGVLLVAAVAVLAPRLGK